MDDVVTHAAKDLAHDLDVLLDDFLTETNLDDRWRIAERLRQFMWDNKVGILRVMQAHAEVKG